MSGEAPSTAGHRPAEDFGVNGGFWGCGVGFRGSYFASKEDRARRIETRTRWVMLLYLPIVPLATYRLIRDKDVVSARGKLASTFELVSRERLAWGQVVRVWLLWLAIALVVCIASVWWINS